MRRTRFRSIRLCGPALGLFLQPEVRSPRGPGPSAPHWAQGAGRPGPQPHLPASLAAPDGVPESRRPRDPARASPSAAPHSCPQGSRSRQKAASAPPSGRSTRRSHWWSCMFVPPTRWRTSLYPSRAVAMVPQDRSVRSGFRRFPGLSGDFMEKEEEECSVRHPQAAIPRGPRPQIPHLQAVSPHGQGCGALFSYILTRILALPLTRCLILGKSQRGAEPQLLLSNGDNSPHVAAACL